MSTKLIIKNPNGPISAVAAVQYFDATINKVDGIDQFSLLQFFTSYCKRWSFQLEKGTESGQLHYQCRINTKERFRPDTLANKFRNHFSDLKLSTVHISSTSRANTSNDFYVTKEDTRVEGPWRFPEEEPINTKEKCVIERCDDVSDMTQLFPWQHRMIKILQTPDKSYRLINCVYNDGGGIGKSRFARYCSINKIARKVPTLTDVKDIMGYVIGFPSEKAYIIDMPKSMKKHKNNLDGFYSGIECLKDGYAFDLRYKAKERYFNPPNVVIFTNSIPSLDHLSIDRWIFWWVDKNLNLRRFDPSDISSVELVRADEFVKVTKLPDLYNDEDILPRPVPTKEFISAINPGFFSQIVPVTNKEPYPCEFHHPKRCDVDWDDDSCKSCRKNRMNEIDDEEEAEALASPKPLTPLRIPTIPMFVPTPKRI